MPGQPNEFAYMYAVTMTDSGFILNLSDQEGHSGTVFPDRADVFISDDIADPTFNGTDNPLILGDAFNDRMDIFTTPDLDPSSSIGTFRYVALAAVGLSDPSAPPDPSQLGFIVQQGSQLYFITNTEFDPNDTNETDRTLTFGSGVVDICFMAGTHIATPTGEAPVETLKIGDFVCTADGRVVPVRWIGRQTVAPKFAKEGRLPVRIRASALADNVPCRDLVASADHALLVDGLLVHAGALVNGTSIVREENVPAIFTYYHIEVDDHSLILAENTPAETFIDNVDRMNFDNWREYQELYPEARMIVEMPYVRAKAYRQVPQSTRVRLAERALLMSGQPVASAA